MTAARRTAAAGLARGRRACVLAVVLLGGLGGCANRPADSTISRSGDLVTPSDESDGRRRARIRLELAANYFDQGQTTVALDEVKQSIVADAGFAQAYNLRGLIYMRLNELPLAEESFRRAQQLDPRDAGTQHNYAWLLCQQQRYDESRALFVQATSNIASPGRSKSLMAQGLCEARAGRTQQAEQLLASAYELDAGNPIIGYNLAQLLFQRGDMQRARFYIRRLNNSEYANAESLWLGIRVELRLDDRVAMQQLADQLRKRFPESREFAAYERGTVE